MSGICGIIDLHGTGRIRETLDLMAVSLRSGSDEGIKTICDDSVGIGIACKRAEDHQSSSDDLILAVRGEIYEPRGASITGIVTEAYRQYGERCVEHLEGKFNFCIWDKRQEKLIVATDRFGSSIINYYYDEKRFIFASKIKAITSTSFFTPTIDKTAIYNYCVFTFVPTPQTIYSQVKKLPPGHIATVQKGKLETRKYWDIFYSDDKSGHKPDAYYSGRIREEMEAAVKRRFDPAKDIERVGAFLSGGLDSSTVAGLMRKIAGRETKAFSIGFNEAKYNELEYVNIAAKHFGLKSFQYIIQPHELPDAIRALVKEHDEPFGNSSAIAAYYCMKMAKDNGVEVLLGGDGGDENFGGYERYVVDKMYAMYQYLPDILKKSIVEPFLFSGVSEKSALLRKMRNYVEHSNIPNPERFFFYELYSMRKRSEIFSDDFLEEAGVNTPLDVINGYYKAPETLFPMNRLTYIDSKIGLIDNDLRNKIDKTSQALGVDARFPMLDVKLWELGAEIPVSLKLKGFTKKYIYKKAFETFLPKEIINKKKHGFGLPFAVWLREDPVVRKYAEDILLDPSSERRGYFKNGFFKKMLSMHDSEESSYYGDLLWPFLMLEVWFREWVDK